MSDTMTHSDEVSEPDWNWLATVLEARAHDFAVPSEILSYAAALRALSRRSASNTAGVERYYPAWSIGQMNKDQRGEWVKFSDYAALSALEPIQAGGEEPVARAYRELRVWANEVLTAHDKRPGDTRAMDNALRGLRGAYESLSATRPATPVSAEVTEAIVRAVKPYTITTLFVEELREIVRAALATLDRGQG